MLLDGFQGLEFVDFAVQLPKDFPALIVSQFLRAIARHLIKILILIWRARLILLLKIDVFLDQDTRTRGLEIRAEFRISRQVLEVHL